jgi:hypothetical protein
LSALSVVCRMCLGWGLWRRIDTWDACFAAAGARIRLVAFHLAPRTLHTRGGGLALLAFVRLVMFVWKPVLVIVRP